MNTDEFLRTITPAAKHSQLAPWWKQIKELRERNCTLAQVCDFLAANEVDITIAGLSKYIKRREAKESNANLQNQPTHRQAHSITPRAQEKSNPLRALGGNRKLGDHNPIPQSKPEFDE